MGDYCTAKYQEQDAGENESLLGTHRLQNHNSVCFDQIRFQFKKKLSPLQGLSEKWSIKRVRCIWMVDIYLCPVVSHTKLQKSVAQFIAKESGSIFHRNVSFDELFNMGDYCTAKYQ